MEGTYFLGRLFIPFGKKATVIPMGDRVRIMRATFFSKMVRANAVKMDGVASYLVAEHLISQYGYTVENFQDLMDKHGDDADAIFGRDRKDVVVPSFAMARIYEGGTAMHVQVLDDFLVIITEAPEWKR